MMKKIDLSTLLTIAFVVAFSTLTKSQERIGYSITEVPKKTQTTFDNVKYSITDGDDTYLFSGKGIYLKGSTEVYRLNADLTLEKESTIKLKAGSNTLFYTSSLIIDETIYILGFDPTGSTELDIYCQLVDKNTLTTLGEPMKIGTSRYSNVSTYFPESMFMLKSDDQSKVLIGFSNLDEDNANEVLELHCFDKNLSKIYSKSMKGQSSDGSKKLWILTDQLAKTVSSFPMLVDNEGNFIIGLTGMQSVVIFEVPNNSSDWVTYSKKLTKKLWDQSFSKQQVTAMSF